MIHIDHTISLYKNLAEAELFIVPGASHFVMFEYPELVNSEIIRFLKSPDRVINNYYFAE